MDNTRILLWFAFLAMLWLSFNQWVDDYSVPPPETVQPADSEGGASSSDDTLPSIEPTDDTPILPETEPTRATELVNPIHVQTDVLDLIIDERGGDIVRVDLPTYPVEKDDPEHIVRLLDYVPSQRWVFQTGVRNATESTGPTHLARYTSAANEYVLADGADDLVVTLEWTADPGLSGRKVYTFHRGRFDVDLEIQVENTESQPWAGVSYAQIRRLHIPVERTFMSVDSYSFTGPVLYDGDQYEKLDFDDLQTAPVVQELPDGWLASIQHHFLAAAIPPAGEVFRYEATARGQEYVLTAVGRTHAVEPSAIQSFPFQLFVGPKLQDQLNATRDGLALTVDYGLLTVLAQPLFWVLEKVHGFLGNWGWSIIVVTFLIKLAFYKLTATSGRSMARMRKVAPRMKALQERFKDDRQALSQAMMELYKKEKVNPAAGCLPIIIQMPFFFAFYWVLIESVEMRQAPFILWIDDLSVRDPYFILPLLMGAAMFFQTRLNPAPPDPTQARIMQIMPIVFTAFFAFFPSGLVIYWLTNTVLSILQQWRINKLVAVEA
jgi:YidC/Oxa1 family membrane protein insertase